MQPATAPRRAAAISMGATTSRALSGKSIVEMGEVLRAEVEHPLTVRRASVASRHPAV